MGGDAESLGFYRDDEGKISKSSIDFFGVMCYNIRYKLDWETKQDSLSKLRFHLYYRVSFPCSYER